MATCRETHCSGRSGVAGMVRQFRPHDCAGIRGPRNRPEERRQAEAVRRAVRRRIEKEIRLGVILGLGSFQPRRNGTDDCPPATAENSFGVSFHSYTEPHLSTDNELVRNILLASLSSLAKVEAQKISERTKAGMARAKAKGIKIGRPKLGVEFRQKISCPSCQR